jgi:hypothetical protein
MNEKEKIDRANRVGRLLNDPEFSLAFDNTKKAIFEKIEQTPLRDNEGLMHLRICLKLLNDVRANLISAINDGKQAEFNIEQAKKHRFTLFRGNT